MTAHTSGLPTDHRDRRSALFSVVSVVSVVCGRFGVMAQGPTVEPRNEYHCSAMHVSADMVWVPPTTLRVESGPPNREQDAVRHVWVGGFWMDRAPVTNERFARFVAATGYVTVAELPPEPGECTPGLDQHVRARAIVRGAKAARLGPTWHYALGASWRRPHGLTSTIDGREQRPVVHITVIDALAFAAWEGKDLPTDLEWEAAARSGLGEPGYTWRDECIRGRQSDAHGSLIVRNAMGKSDTVGSICEWTAGWYPPRVTDGLASVGGMQGMLGLPDIDLRSPQDPTLRSRREQPNAGPACALSEDDPAMLTARFPEATDPSVWRMGFRCVLRPELGESEPS